MAFDTEQESAQESTAVLLEELDTVLGASMVENSYLWLAAMALEHSQYWPGHVVQQLREKLDWNEQTGRRQPSSGSYGEGLTMALRLAFLLA